MDMIDMKYIDMIETHKLRLSIVYIISNWSNILSVFDEYFDFVEFACIQQLSQSWYVITVWLQFPFGQLL